MGQTVAKVIGKVVNETFPNPNDLRHNWKHSKFIDMEDDQKWIVQQLKSVRVKSSHNSVVGDIQIFGPASINILARVLNAGVRAIELDVFESLKTKGKPVVSHGNMKDNLQVVSEVDLEVCLKYIRDYAWVDTNEPLFIFFEMNIDAYLTQTLKKMVNLMETYLGERIYTSKKALSNVRLHDLKNKVIVLPTTFREELKSIQYTTLYGSGQFVNRSSNEVAIYGVDKLVRVYSHNLIVSNNPEPGPFMDKGNHFVCMNWSYKDENLYTYNMCYFNNKGII